MPTNPIPSKDKVSRSDVMRRLHDWIGNGTLVAGQPLPSERDLAQRLGAGRTVVRGALQMLEEQGRLVNSGGYQRTVAPNAAVRALANTVALISSSLSQLVFSQHQNEAKLDVQLLSALEQADLHTLLLHTSRLNAADVSCMIEARPAGMIVGEVTSELERIAQLANSFKKAGSPVVAYGRWTQLMDYDSVTSDHEGGSYDLTRWMIEQGRERIVQVWPLLPTNYWFAERDRGYQRAMTEVGLKPLPPILAPPTTLISHDGHLASPHELWVQQVRSAAGHLVEHLVGPQGADALLIHNDTQTFHIMAACRLCGRQPNVDLWIGGYDDSWREWVHRPDKAWEPNIPMVTVRKNNQQAARDLMELLRARAAGDLPDEPQKRVAPCEVVVTPAKDLEQSLADALAYSDA